jgi:hypothetical protein
MTFTTRDPGHVGLEPSDYSVALPYPKLNADGDAFEPSGGADAATAGSYPLAAALHAGATLDTLDGPDGAPLTLYVNGPQAVYDPGTLRTYYVWLGEGRDLYAAYYDHLTGTQTAPTFVATYPIADDNDHGAPSLALAPDGRLHVSWGSHNSIAYHSKTNNPHDLTAWTTTSTGRNGTYTWMFVRPDGDLLIFYRASTHSTWAFTRSTDGGATWSAETPIITMSGAPEAHVDVYMMGVTEVAGKLHLSWLLSRNATHDGGRRDVYHAVYNLETGTLATIDGTALPVPLTWTDEASVRVATDAPVWQLAHLVREDGLVHIAYTTGTDGTGEAGTYTVHVVTWDGTAWTTVDTGIPQGWRWSGLAMREVDGAVVGLFCNRTGARTDLGVWTSADGATWQPADPDLLPGTTGEGVERLALIRSGPWLTMAQEMPTGWARTSATAADLLPIRPVALASASEVEAGGSAVASYGQVTVTDPDTSKTVLHGLPQTPALGEIQLTPVDDTDGWLDGAASTRYGLRDLTATEFTVAVSPAPGTGKHATFGWLWVSADAAPTAPLDYYDEVVADSPLGYWRLGEASGTVAADEQAFKNGTYYNSPTLGVAGAIAGDTAATFNGSNQYVDIAHDAAWNSTDITVEAWVKTTTALLGLIVSRDTGGSSNRDFQFRVNAGKIEFVNLRGNGVGATTLTGATSVNDDVWHHVVAVRSGAAVTLYVDGVQDAASSAMQAPGAATSAINLARNVSNAAYLAGSLDEVAYYGTALTASRVAAHHAAA